MVAYLYCSEKPGRNRHTAYLYNLPVGIYCNLLLQASDPCHKFLSSAKKDAGRKRSDQASSDQYKNLQVER